MRVLCYRVRTSPIIGITLRLALPGLVEDACDDDVCRLPCGDVDLGHLTAGDASGLPRPPARHVVCPDWNRDGETAIVSKQ